MSNENPNLSQKQFNQAKVTRLLTAAGEDRRRRGKTRKRSSYPVYHPGFDYSPVDANTTAIQWHGSGNGPTNPEARKGHHDNIVQALKTAGISAEVHGDAIHVKH